MARLRRGKGADNEFFPGFTDIAEIGIGSLATVYRAREVGTNRSVALKLLNVRDASPRAIESFERESVALGAVSSHPNIVTLYRSFRAADGRPVLVLELCRGSIGDTMVNGQGLPVADVVAMGIKIAGALETAHRAEILHRDVKPQNILITEFGEPALADFGVAMLQSSTQTTAGLFDFTTLHAAPELLEGGETSAATDVYELASSLYQLIAGKSAFRAYDGESPASVILRILRDPVQPLVNANVPTRLSDLLLHAMSKDKDARPPTAAEFASELAEVEAAEGWSRTPFLIRDPDGRSVGPPSVTRLPALRSKSGPPVGFQPAVGGAFGGPAMAGPAGAGPAAVGPAVSGPPAGQLPSGPPSWSSAGQVPSGSPFSLTDPPTSGLPLADPTPAGPPLADPPPWPPGPVVPPDPTSWAPAPPSPPAPPSAPPPAPSAAPETVAGPEPEVAPAPAAQPGDGWGAPVLSQHHDESAGVQPVEPQAAVGEFQAPVAERQPIRIDDDDWSTPRMVSVENDAPAEPAPPADPAPPDGPAPLAEPAPPGLATSPEPAAPDLASSAPVAEPPAPTVHPGPAAQPEPVRPQPTPRLAEGDAVWSPPVVSAPSPELVDEPPIAVPELEPAPEPVGDMEPDGDVEPAGTALASGAGDVGAPVWDALTRGPAGAPTDTAPEPPERRPAPQPIVTPEVVQAPPFAESQAIAEAQPAPSVDEAPALPVAAEPALSVEALPVAQPEPEPYPSAGSVPQPVVAPEPSPPAVSAPPDEAPPAEAQPSPAGPSAGLPDWGDLVAAAPPVEPLPPADRVGPPTPTGRPAPIPEAVQPQQWPPQSAPQPPQQFPIPPAASQLDPAFELSDPAGDASGTMSVPTWAFRAPGNTGAVPLPTGGYGPAGQAPAGDLMLDPMSLRRRVTIRSGMRSLVVDEQQLAVRTLFKRSEIPWHEVRGFELRPDAGDAASGQIVAITHSGPIELPATKRALTDLRYVHALLDAYRIRAQTLAGR